MESGQLIGHDGFMLPCQIKPIKNDKKLKMKETSKA